MGALISQEIGQRIVQGAALVPQAARVPDDIPNVVAQLQELIGRRASQEIVQRIVPGAALVPEAARVPDDMGACILLPNVRAQLQELIGRRTREGEQFPGWSTIVDPLEKHRWMEYFGLSQLPINMIVWPGTHDSATYAIGERGITRPFAQCQTLSIYEQLRAGVRTLDIRIQQDGRVCHGILVAPYGIDTVIRDVKRFLNETRMEIIILEVRTEYGHSDPPNFGNYLVDHLGEHLIHQDDQVFSTTIGDVLPRRIICIWKPRNSQGPDAGGPLWNGSYLKDDWINTDMPFTKFNGNKDNLRNQSPVSERKYFYRVEHTLTAQTDNPGELLILWTKHVEVLTRRIRGFARLFLANCHNEGILDKLQIYSADYIDDDFIAACIGLNHARLMMIPAN